MGLGRTALRLAAIPALLADPVVTALCDDRIFDSRIYELTETDPVPMVVVLTEEEQGGAWSANNGGPPFNTRVDLVLEISIRAVIPSADGQTVDLRVPYLDAEMEASLDLLEDCCIYAIAAGDTPASIAVRQTVLRRVHEVKSGRFVSDETGIKLAVRLVTLSCEVKGYAPDPLAPPTGPFAALPDPLRSVALTLDPDSSGYATCVAVANRMSPPVATQFTGADITLAVAGAFDPANPPAPSGPTPAGSVAADPILATIEITP